MPKEKVYQIRLIHSTTRSEITDQEGINPFNALLRAMTRLGVAESLLLGFEVREKVNEKASS